MSKNILVLLFACFHFITCLSQIQLGQNIDGALSGDLFGWKVELSNDGSILAASSIDHDSKRGHVRLYELNGSMWVQKGTDIEGEAVNDLSGISLSLSGSGETIAIGAAWNDGNGYNSGHTRVYVWNSAINDWDQRGSDIDGAASGDESGHGVSLNYNGNIVAIGAANNDNPGQNSGHVRIFEWNATTQFWDLLTEINGESSGDTAGYGVSLNDSGDIVAVGSEFADNNGPFAPGHVRVFKRIGASWTQLGSAMNGEGYNDLLGGRVCLSSSGNTIVVSSPSNDENGIDAGHVRVYDYDSNNDVWKNRGPDIDGNFPGDSFGQSISVSDDGNIIAVGATGSGRVSIFKWNACENDWLNLGQDIFGQAANDLSGFSVSLNGQGEQIAIGSIWHNNFSGNVRVYGLDNTAASLPYTNNFESGTLDNYWTNVTSSAGFNQVTDLHKPCEQNKHLMIAANSAGLNSQTLHLDLSQVTSNQDVFVEFTPKAFGAYTNNHTQQPNQSEPEDGVFISDGNRCIKISSFIMLPKIFGLCPEKRINISNIMRVLGMNFDKNFSIKFQQKTNNVIGKDGVAIDDLRIYTQNQYHKRPHRSKSLATSLSIFPNPAYDWVSVQLPTGLSKEGGIVHLLNLEGKVIIEKPIDKVRTEIKLPLHDLSSGIYIVNFISSETTLTERLVVSH